MSLTPRIASLLPSATEIVALLGATDQLVARSHECDFPPAVLAVPAVTSQNTTARSPAAIDAMVREQLATGGDLYRIDQDALARARPDVIITQDLCAVCSISLDTVRGLAAALSPVPQITSLNPETFEAVLDSILTVGDAIGSAAQAQQAVVELRERFFAAADIVNPFADGPVVAFLEWTDPLYIGGHWTPQLVERAGGRHLLNPCQAKPGSGAAIGPQNAERVAGPSVRVPPEIFEAIKPEYVIVCPCGVGLADAVAQTHELAQREWFKNTPAFQNGRIAIVDGNHMFNRPGPRLVDAFEWLAGWLNDRPELIPADFPVRML